MNTKTFVIAFMLILAAGILARSVTGIFHPGLFMEPDNYVYYWWVQTTIQNNYVAPNSSWTFSFFTPPTNRSNVEAAFLAYVPAYVYRLFGGAISLYNVMFALPVIAAIIEMLLVYLITMELCADRRVALLAMLFFAVLPAAMWKNSIGEYRGESFVPVLAALLVLLSLYFVRAKGKLQKAALFVGVLVLVPISQLYWQAGIYVAIIPCMFLLFMLGYRLLGKYHVSYIVTLVVVLLVCIAGAAYTTSPAHCKCGLPPNAQVTISETEPPTFVDFLSVFGMLLILMPIGMVYLFKRGVGGRLWIMSSFVAVTFSLSLFWLRFNILPTIPFAILGALGFFYAFDHLNERNMRFNLVWLILAVAFMQALIFAANIRTFAPTDGISPAFIQAMSWIKNNTAPNSTILANWEDGSVILGVANRRVYYNSVTALNNSTSFYNFLFADAGNFSLFQSVHPDYLLARYYWRFEGADFLLEDDRNANESLNGTNYQALENGTEALPIVYRNNDSIVYCVYACGIT